MIIGTNEQMGISDAFYKGDYLTIIRQLEGISEMLGFIDFELLSIYSDYVDAIKDGFANGDCESVALLLKDVVHTLRSNGEQMLKYAASIEESKKHMQRNCKQIRAKKR